MRLLLLIRGISVYPPRVNEQALECGPAAMGRIDWPPNVVLGFEYSDAPKEPSRK